MHHIKPFTGKRCRCSKIQVNQIFQKFPVVKFPWMEKERFLRRFMPVWRNDILNIPGSVKKIYILKIPGHLSAVFQLK